MIFFLSNAKWLSIFQYYSWLSSFIRFPGSVLPHVSYISFIHCWIPISHSFILRACSCIYLVLHLCIMICLYDLLWIHKVIHLWLVWVIVIILLPPYFELQLPHMYLTCSQVNSNFSIQSYCWTWTGFIWAKVHF